MEVFNKELKNFLLFFFSLTYWFGVNGQTITEKDIKKLSIEINKEFINFEDPYTGIKGRGVIPIGKKLIFQYNVPEEWYPSGDIKEVLINNLIVSENYKMFVKYKIDRSFYYFKNNRIIKTVTVNWEELNKFILGEYLELTSHPKSNGLEYKIRPPINWEIKEGDRPHIVKKFINEQMIYLILIYETGQFFTKKEVKELFQTDSEIKEFINSMSKETEFKLTNYKVITIDNHPFLYYTGDLKKEINGIEIKSEVHYWTSLVEDQLISFMGSDSSKNNSYPKFLKITNSVIFLNQY
tara:strand:- start:1798 stop:2682 length:885 start_codon:yes stop_codon:yes gene_type:complete